MFINNDKIVVDIVIKKTGKGKHMKPTDSFEMFKLRLFLSDFPASPFGATFVWYSACELIN